MKLHKLLYIVPLVLFVAFEAWVIHSAGQKEVEVEVPEPTMMVVVRYATKEEQEQRDQETINAIAQTVWGEARGCSKTEQAAVVWCILNRVDSAEFPNDPLMVVQQADQFDGYNPDYPGEQQMVDLVLDVMARWELEKKAVGSVGRVLPKEFTYFHGDNHHNYFRDAYIGGNTWKWTLDSPYEECENERNSF